MKLLLNDSSHDYRVILLTCYGARGVNWANRHDNILSLKNEVTTSFAFKVYSAVCHHRKISMVAFIGAVGYNQTSFIREVTTEVGIMRLSEMEKLRKKHRINIDKTRQVMSNKQEVVNGVSLE